jgi:hypothetical protein
MTVQTRQLLEIRAVLAASGDPALLGKVAAFAAALNSLARRDHRYQDIARATDRMWAALVLRRPFDIRRAAVDVCKEADRLLREVPK